MKKILFKLKARKREKTDPLEKTSLVEKNVGYKLLKQKIQKDVDLTKTDFA